jgi:hypothetical protein
MDAHGLAGEIGNHFNENGNPGGNYFCPDFLYCNEALIRVKNRLSYALIGVKNPTL